MEIKNTVVVITGASSGIGRATALELARKGANLVLVARREQALHGLVEECERLGGEALSVPTDVSIEEHIYGVARKAITRFGKIDVWINNAAVTAAGNFEEIPMQDVRRVLEINLFGYIYGARAVIPHFKRQGFGILINVSSMVATTGEPFFAPYVISKFGISGLSASLNQELEDKNVQVCTVLPSVIDTPIYNQAANYMGKAIKAPGEPIPAEEVSNAIIGLIKNPQPEVFVGGMGKLTSAMRWVAPSLFDKKAHDKILHEHFEEESDTRATKGNLYDPMKEYASVSGGWIQEKDGKATTTYLVSIAAAVGAALGVAYYFKNKKLAEAAK